MILEKTIEKGSKLLKKNSIRSHSLDAEVILSNIMGVNREYLITNSKMQISKEIIKKYDRAIKRRSFQEPVAYIVGKKEFWSEDFVVSYSTLIPRPETELMLYKVINIFKNKNINILDIGTGSGCLLLSILKELDKSRGVGIDISKEAIRVAKVNSKKLKLSNRAKFKVFDVDKFNLDKYDLILSNPPYIALRDIKNLSKDIINYEPLLALKGGNDGLDLIKKVIYKSSALLKKSGLLVVEIGNNQYKQVSNLLRRNGFKELSKEHDLKNNVRCIIGTKK